jgi:hypothetical protein
MYLVFLYIFISFNNPSDTLTNPDITFGSFENAECISASRDNYLFISDIYTNMIYKYSKKGELLIKIGGPGLNENQFNNPSCIDAKNGLDVYIVDYNNNRIQKYDINLHYITLFDFNNYNLTSGLSSKIYYPISMAVLPSSDIFVIKQTGEDKLFKIINFSDIFKFDVNNFGKGMLKKPANIVTDNTDYIYILDNEQNAIIIYDIVGNYISKLVINQDKSLVNLCYYDSKLFILSNNEIIIYDINKKQYTKRFIYKIENIQEKPKGIEFLENNSVYLLSNKKVYKYNLNIN